jgi:AcrR family transcriptional regulator
MPGNASSAAERLFDAKGIRAVGVERLLAESGVGRASFYRLFPSKNDLREPGPAAALRAKRFASALLAAQS